MSQDLHKFCPGPTEIVPDILGCTQTKRLRNRSIRVYWSQLAVVPSCILDGEAIEKLRQIFFKVCADFELLLAHMDGESNRLRLLVNYPPKVSVSSLVNSLKGVSSYVLRRQLPRVASCYWKNVLWSPSYFAASCGGAPLAVIQRYIEQQATPL